VLVVTHEATRTGAPIVAAQVADAIRRAGIRTVVVSRWPGPLDDRLLAASDRYRLEPFRRLRVLARRRWGGAPWVDRLDERIAARVLDAEPVDLVWCNTVLSANYVPPALDRGIPVVLYVHELGRLIPGALRRYGATSWPQGLRTASSSPSPRARPRRVHRPPRSSKSRSSRCTSSSPRSMSPR
jgi:hypothetical protein